MGAENSQGRGRDVWLERVEKDEEEAGARLKRMTEGRERALLSHRDRGRWREGGRETG